LGSCSKLGEADPGGLGACPQEKSLAPKKTTNLLNNWSGINLLFQKKKQKALFCLAEDLGSCSKLGEANPGGLEASGLIVWLFVLECVGVPIHGDKARRR
jgi:hypothetical protein